MIERNAGLTADVLFVAVTRPPMRWGVTFSALMFNLVFTMEAFLLTKNLLTLLTALPIHGVCALLCARDARFFEVQESDEAIAITLEDKGADSSSRIKLLLSKKAHPRGTRMDCEGCAGFGYAHRARRCRQS